MKKQEAIELFGNNISQMAKVIGVSRYTIMRWPENLEQHQANMVRGAKAKQLTDERRKLEQANGE